MTNLIHHGGTEDTESFRFAEAGERVLKSINESRARCLVKEAIDVAVILETDREPDQFLLRIDADPDIGFCNRVRKVK